MSNQETKQIKKTLSHLQDDKRTSKIERKKKLSYEVNRMYWDFYSRKQSNGKALDIDQRKKLVKNFIEKYELTAKEMRYQIVHPRLYSFVSEEAKRLNRDIRYPLSTILGDFMTAPSASDEYQDVQTKHKKETREKYGSVPVDFSEIRTENKMYLNGIYAPSAYTEVLREEAAEMTDEEREEELKLLVNKLSEDKKALKSFASRHGVPADQLAEGIAKIKKRKIKTCHRCSSVFFAGDARERYCSGDCRKSARQERDKYRYRNK